MATVPTIEEHGTKGPVPGLSVRERWWGVSLYAMAFVACVGAIVAMNVFSGNFVWTAIFVPPVLIVALWLGLQGRSAFLDAHGREVLGVVLTTVAMGVVGLPSAVFVPVGLLVYALIAAFGVLCLMCGAWHAAKGWYYRAPLCRCFRV